MSNVTNLVEAVTEPEKTNVILVNSQDIFPDTIVLMNAQKELMKKILVLVPQIMIVDVAKDVMLTVNLVSVLLTMNVTTVIPDSTDNQTPSKPVYHLAQKTTSRMTIPEPVNNVLTHVGLVMEPLITIVPLVKSHTLSSRTNVLNHVQLISTLEPIKLVNHVTELVLLAMLDPPLIVLPVQKEPT